MSNPFNRREFLHRAVAGSATLAASTALPLPCSAAVTKPERDAFHGLKIGITSYTLRKLSLDDALARTRDAGIKYISLKEVHAPLKSTPDERRAIRKKVEDAGLVLMGGGVIYMKNDPAQLRNTFEYAKDLGMKTIVCSPDPEALDEVEKLVKEYDIRIAIHNHGPGDKLFPSPNDVLRAVEHRDARMGACIDIGHTVRLGEDPVAAINKCAKRLYEMHLKDVTAPKADAKPTELGKGIIDLTGVLRALIKLKWPYHAALEYEARPDNVVPGMMECFGYLRGALAAM